MTINRSGSARKNMFLNDALLFKAAQDLPTALLSGFEDIGAFVAGKDAWELARLANIHKPSLRRYDDWGQEVETFDFHPAYQALLRYSYQAGLVSSLWERRAGESGVRYQARAIRLFLIATLESGHLSGIASTSAGIAALSGEADLYKQWQPILLSRKYDGSTRLLAQKESVMLSFAFSPWSENAGGVNNISATLHGFDEKQARDAYAINGARCRLRNPVADGVFVTAEIKGEPCCLFVPRFNDQSQERQFRIQNVIHGAGLASSAIGEVMFQANRTWLIGQIGQGRKLVNDVETMLRFDQAVIGVGILRRIVDYGITLFRSKGQYENINIAERVFADMALDVAAAEALVMRLARAFDHAAQDKQEAAFARIMTPVIAFWVSNLIAPICAETIVQSGNDTFYEDSPLTRILNDGPAWAVEGFGNNRLVQDVMHSAQRAPKLFSEVLVSIGSTIGNGGTRTVEVLEAATQVVINEPSAGRLLVEQMAYAAGAAALMNSEIDPVINAFVESRLAGQWRSSYGTLSARHNARQIIDLLYPQG